MKLEISDEQLKQFNKTFTDKESMNNAFLKGDKLLKEFLRFQENLAEVVWEHERKISEQKTLYPLEFHNERDFYYEVIKDRLNLPVFQYQEFYDESPLNPVTRVPFKNGLKVKNLPTVNTGIIKITEVSNSLEKSKISNLYKQVWNNVYVNGRMEEKKYGHRELHFPLNQTMYFMSFQKMPTTMITVIPDSLIPKDSLTDEAYKNQFGFEKRKKIAILRNYCGLPQYNGHENLLDWVKKIHKQEGYDHLIMYCLDCHLQYYEDVLGFKWKNRGIINVGDNTAPLLNVVGLNLK